MRYNTGKASHQISANSRFWYGEACNRNNPTEKQKKYWKRLLAECGNHNIPFQELGVAGKLVTRMDYSQAIKQAEKYLVDRGLWQPTVNQYSKKQDAKREERHKEFEATEWIRLDEKLPDTEYVRTLDKYGRIYTLKWNAEYECFVSPSGIPILKINNRRHKYRKPIAWAYIKEK